MARNSGSGYGATDSRPWRKTSNSMRLMTVTAVEQTPGLATYLAADAKVGDTNIKVSSVANISVGDKIRLDIGSSEHGVETVTVTWIGALPIRSGNPGNGQK